MPPAFASLADTVRILLELGSLNTLRSTPRRRSRSYSRRAHSGCVSDACHGWTTPASPSQVTTAFEPQGNDMPRTAWGGPHPAATGVRNHWGQDSLPRENDLRLGSERMRSRIGGDYMRTGSWIPVKHPSRPSSVGADRRYGKWTQSSVQFLLRHDN